MAASVPSRPSFVRGYHVDHLGRTATRHDRPDGVAAPARTHAAGARRSAPPWQDWLFERTTMFFALFVLLHAASASSARLPWAAVPAFQKFGLGFFFTNVWDPVKLNFGALAPIYGTLVTSAIALLIGVPVSFGIALFLTEMCPVVLKRPLGTAVELLAAIPSIIYGMWGLFVFAPVFGDYVQPAAHQGVRRPVDPRARCSRARRTASACCRRASSCRSW